MPNIKDVSTEQTTNSFLVLGDTGSGKTTLGLTHPRRVFAYFFDPNALNSAVKMKALAGFNLDYEEFLIRASNLDIRSLKKGVGDKKSRAKSSDIYLRWEEDYEGKLDSGFFEDYDCIMFDSLTTFGDLVMDRVLSMNGRYGEWPQQDDYGPQMNAIAKVFRAATAINKDLFVTGHLMFHQDKLSQRIFQSPLVTGQLKTKLPLLFSQIWALEGAPEAGTKKDMHYTIQTKPDRMRPLIRNTIDGLEFKHDVTIDFKKPLKGQGLGSII